MYGISHFQTLGLWALSVFFAVSSFLLDACEFKVPLDPSCAAQLEQHLIEHKALKVQRNSNFLHLETEAGAVSFPIFKEKTDEDTQPFVVAYLKDVELIVVWVFESPGRSVYLINRKTGIQTQINGFPLLSPDKKRLLVYSEAHTDKENANLIVIYKIRYTKLRAEIVLSGDDNRLQPWNPMNMRWVNPTQVEFTRLHNQNGQPEHKKQNLIFEKGKWLLH
jgi:hypothetical protein